MVESSILGQNYGNGGRKWLKVGMKFKHECKMGRDDFLFIHQENHKISPRHHLIPMIQTRPIKGFGQSSFLFWIPLKLVGIKIAISFLHIINFLLALGAPKKGVCPDVLVMEGFHAFTNEEVCPQSTDICS